MAQVQEVLGHKSAARVVVAGDRWVVPRSPVHEHEWDVAPVERVQEDPVEFGVAEDHPLDASVQRRLGRVLPALRVVIGVGDERRQAPFSGDFFNALVDGCRDKVGEARDQHTDGAAAPGAEAGGMGVGAVAEVGGDRPDPRDCFRGGRLAGSPRGVEHPGDRGGMDAGEFCDRAQSRRPTR